jgi:hypothetical protein
MTKTLLAAAALATLATSAQAGKYIPSPVAVVAIKDIATLNKPSPDTDVLKAAWIAKYLFFCAKPVPVDQYQPSERAANDWSSKVQKANSQERNDEADEMAEGVRKISRMDGSYCVEIREKIIDTFK